MQIPECDRRQFMQLLGVGVVGTVAGSPTGTASPNASADETWSTFNYSPQGTRLNPNIAGPSDGLELTWEIETGGMAAPVTDGELLYAGGDQLYALERDGSIAWEQAGGDWSNVAVDEDHVYASVDEMIVALDKSGDFVWEFPHELEIAAVLPHGDTVTVTAGYLDPGISEPGIVYQLDAATGEPLWEREIEDMWYNGSTNGQQVYIPVTQWDGGPADIVSLDADSGDETWRTTLESDTFGPIAVGDDYVYVADDVLLYALDAESGDIDWDVSLTNALGAIVVGDDFIHALVLENNEAELVTFERATGNQRSQYVIDGVEPTNATLVGTAEHIYAWTFEEDRISVINQTSEEVVGEIPVGEPVFSVIPSEDALYVASDGLMLELADDDGGSAPDSPDVEEVIVGPDGDHVFAPDRLEIDPGTTVEFVWQSNDHNIAVQSGPSDGWDGHETVESAGFVHEHTFEVEGTYEYICEPHAPTGMVGEIIVGTADESDDVDDPEEGEQDPGDDDPDDEPIDDTIEDDDVPDDPVDDDEIDDDEETADEPDDVDSADDDSSVTFTDVDDDSQPGFGVPGALAGLGGAGYLLKRRLDRDELE